MQKPRQQSKDVCGDEMLTGGDQADGWEKAKNDPGGRTVAMHPLVELMGKIHERLERSGTNASLSDFRVVMTFVSFVAASTTSLFSSCENSFARHQVSDWHERDHSSPIKLVVRRRNKSVDRRETGGRVISVALGSRMKRRWWSSQQGATRVRHSGRPGATGSVSVQRCCRQREMLDFFGHARRDGLSPRARGGTSLRP